MKQNHHVKCNFYVLFSIFRVQDVFPTTHHQLTKLASTNNFVKKSPKKPSPHPFFVLYPPLSFLKCHVILSRKTVLSDIAFRPARSAPVAIHPNYRGQETHVKLTTVVGCARSLSHTFI